jgi:plastocyanin
VNRELRERAILPVLIPLAAIVVTEIVVFSLSRVLLATGKTTAVVIALGTALAILIGSAAVAAGRRVRTSSIVGLLVMLLIVAVGAGAVAFQRGPFYEREEAANLPEIDVTAKDLAFNTKTLELSPAGAVINFTNADTQPHNMAIYPGKDKLTEALFKGEITSGGQKATYKVGRIAPGEYYFQCDVHPTMNGKAIVEMGAGSAAHEGAHG